MEGKRVRFVNSKGGLYLKHLDNIGFYKLDEFMSEWESKGYFNGKKIGVKNVKETEEELVITYYKTDYMTFRYIHNYLSKSYLPDYILNCSLGIHLIVRDASNFIITDREFDAMGNRVQDKLYQLSTSEGIEVSDVELKDKEIIPNLINRSLEEELGLSIRDFEYRFLFYSDYNNRPYIVYEVKVEDLYDTNLIKTQSSDKLKKVEDIKGERILTLKDIKNIEDKFKTNHLKEYLQYLEEKEDNGVSIKV